MHLVDWVVVAAYFALVLGVAWWATGRHRATRESSAVSLLTPPPSEEHLRGLTFGARRAAPFEPRSPHFAVTAGLSALLLATVAGVWLYFR